MMRKILVSVAAVVILFPGLVLASGGSPMSVPTSPGTPPAPRLTPEQEAAKKYNDGLKHKDKADALAKEAGAAGLDEKKRAKLESSARKEYDKAREEFLAATEKNPMMFQAHGDLGYVYRRTGDYTAALASYDRALELSPDYTPAIEYRAEAFLGVNRLEEAKSAYMTLFNSDRARADELTVAMKAWLDKRRQDAAGLAPETIEDFSKWLSQREEIAGRTSALIQPRNPGW
jgi:tetratricopeptide (TPR) repeat protein